MRNVVAIYGNVTIQKAYCQDCGSFSFIRSGRFVCCGSYVSGEPTRYVRECEPEDTKRIPSKCEQEKILKEQDGCCFYCEQKLGSTQYRNGKPFRLKTNWDHKLPYAYSQNNSVGNFVASCHVCNMIKASLVFRDLDEAKGYISIKRKSLGYGF